MTVTEALENLPTAERQKQSAFVWNKDQTRLVARFRTHFDICKEMGFLDDSDEYYHNQFRLYRFAALRPIQPTACIFDKVQGCELSEDEEATLTDFYRQTIRLLSNADTRIIHIICDEIPPGANTVSIRYAMTEVAGQTTRAFINLKKAIDEVLERCDKESRKGVSEN